MDLDPAASGPREETFGGAGMVPDDFVDSTANAVWIQTSMNRSYVCANVTLGVARLSPIVSSQTDWKHFKLPR